MISISHVMKGKIYRDAARISADVSRHAIDNWHRGKHLGEAVTLHVDQVYKLICGSGRGKNIIERARVTGSGLPDDGPRGGAKGSFSEAKVDAHGKDKLPVVVRYKGGSDVPTIPEYR